MPEKLNNTSKSIKCHTLGNSRKHEKQNKINLTNHMPPVQFTKLFFVLQNTIANGARSMLFMARSTMEPATHKYKYQQHLRQHT